MVIINDYMEFRFFRNNVLTATVHIAELKNDKVVARSDGKARFEYLIQQLATPEYHVLSIKSAEDLAVRMGLYANANNPQFISHSKNCYTIFFFKIKKPLFLKQKQIIFKL